MVRKQTPEINLWRQRVGYGAADLACNLIWKMTTLYLLYFYTDVMGIPAVQVGLLFIFARVIDGVSDIAMGFIIDRTHTQWGKARPYLIWGAIPLAVFSILTFYVPNVSTTSKVFYALITYIGLSISYTVVNVPLTAILPMMTSDSHERTVLATSRNIFASFGGAIVAGTTPFLMGNSNADSRARSFFQIMCIYAVVGCLFLVFSFKNVKEVHKSLPERVSFKKALISLQRNSKWRLFAINIIFMWGAFFFQNGALIYYLTYNLNRVDLLGSMASVETIVPLGGTVLAPIISKKFDKKRTFLIASIIHLSGISLMYFAEGQIPVLITGAVISALGFGLRHPIYFSMQADLADHNFIKTGVKAIGIISAINGFVGKIAMAVAATISGLMLSAGNYVPNEKQSESARFAIALNFLIIPAVMIIISIVLMSSFSEENNELGERSSISTP